MEYLEKYNEWCNNELFDENTLPYSQEITKAELFGIASFGQAMINDCFAVEGQYNEKLKEVTIEQLNDVEWCEKFIEQVQSTMDEINNNFSLPSISDGTTNAP